MLDIKDLGLRSLADIGAPDVSVEGQETAQQTTWVEIIDLREFEWWCTPELKVKLGFSTLVNVHHRFFALTDPHARHSVDDLGDVFVGLAFPTGSVTDGVDCELAGKFRNTTEVSGLRSGLAFGAVEGVEHVEWSMA